MNSLARGFLFFSSRSCVAESIISSRRALSRAKVLGAALNTKAPPPQLRARGSYAMCVAVARRPQSFIRPRAHTELQSSRALFALLFFFRRVWILHACRAFLCARECGCRCGGEINALRATMGSLGFCVHTLWCCGYMYLLLLES